MKNDSIETVVASLKHIADVRIDSDDRARIPQSLLELDSTEEGDALLVEIHAALPSGWSAEWVDDDLVIDRDETSLARGRGAVVSRSVEVTVAADPDQDDCLTASASAYIVEHPELKGWDLSPRWTDRNRETVTLSVPRWFYEQLSDTSGT